MHLVKAVPGRKGFSAALGAKFNFLVEDQCLDWSNQEPTFPDF
jgi:hypothetical protein